MKNINKHITPDKDAPTRIQHPIPDNPDAMPLPELTFLRNYYEGQRMFKQTYHRHRRKLLLRRLSATFACAIALSASFMLLRQPDHQSPALATLDPVAPPALAEPSSHPTVAMHLPSSHPPVATQSRPAAHLDSSILPPQPILDTSPNILAYASPSPDFWCNQDSCDRDYFFALVERNIMSQYE